jgi:hypothetical protein
MTQKQMSIDHSRISDVEVGGIDFSDYPDFCDAYIDSAKVDGREATDEEMDEINDDRDFVYEQVLNTIY